MDYYYVKEGILFEIFLILLNLEFFFCVIWCFYNIIKN